MERCDCNTKESSSTSIFDVLFCSLASHAFRGELPGVTVACAGGALCPPRDKVSVEGIVFAGITNALLLRTRESLHLLTGLLHY